MKGHRGKGKRQVGRVRTLWHRGACCGVEREAGCSAEGPSHQAPKPRLRLTGTSASSAAALSAPLDSPASPTACEPFIFHTRLGWEIASCGLHQPFLGSGSSPIPFFGLSLSPPAAPPPSFPPADLPLLLCWPPTSSLPPSLLLTFLGGGICCGGGGMNCCSGGGGCMNCCWGSNMGGGPIMSGLPMCCCSGGAIIASWGAPAG
jgi:hypothetical protein